MSGASHFMRIAAGVAGVGLGAFAAFAAPVRNPETGAPAFVVDAPGDWTVKRQDPTSILLEPSDAGAGLTLTMFEVKANTYTDVTFGEAYLKAIGTGPPAAHAPGAIGGWRGSSWLTSETVNGIVLRDRFTVTSVGPTHFAVMDEQRGPLMTPAQDAAFQRIVASVRIIADESMTPPATAATPAPAPAPRAPARPFVLNQTYVCNGERVAVPHCGSVQQGDYCEVDYLDRTHNGFMVQASEHRSDIAQRLQACTLQ